MKIYLVGGAVRDQLLGLPIKEKDWVVVGATVDEMLRLGFRQVGKDFPVFLHPETQEEYALARKERKVAKGYTGFSFDTSADVTLEEDLERRDLTINAIAQTPDGVLIDPYQGKKDLEKKVLRHVSPAFSEDPVRILRLARFAARFAYLGFSIAKETNELMKHMVKSGEVDALVPERVWKEFERALTEKNPEQFFIVLKNCDALSILFPAIHLENKGMAAFTRAENPIVRFAALLHDLPLADIKLICEQYRVPTDYRELALLVATHVDTFRHTPDLDANAILALLQSVDAFRRQERFIQFLSAAEAVTKCLYAEKLFSYYSVAKTIDVQKWLAQGIQGKELAKRIVAERQHVIDQILKK